MGVGAAVAVAHDLPVGGAAPEGAQERVLSVTLQPGEPDELAGLQRELDRRSHPGAA